MSDERISNQFDCSAEEYWDKLFFNPKYNEDLFMGRLKFESWELVSQEETETEIRRIVEAVPPMPEQVPGALKRVISKGIGYREEGVFNKSERRYTLKAVSHSLPDRLIVTGETTTEPVSETQCQRVHLAHVKAKILGIGGMLEQRVLADMIRSYEKAAKYSNTWIETHLRQS